VVLPSGDIVFGELLSGRTVGDVVSFEVVGTAVVDVCANDLLVSEV
jgi:hypothetical protein